MSLQRRGFLQAMVTALTATTATLKFKERPSGILIPEEPVVVAAEKIVPSHNAGGMLYDAEGNAVLFVRNLSVNMPVDSIASVDITGYPVDKGSLHHLYNRCTRSIKCLQWV